MRELPPGSTIGVLGSGQLGRMLALTALRMGYRTVVFSPDSDTPAGQVSGDEIQASYEDEEALAEFARRADAITVEFENIPVSALEFLERVCPVRPGASVLHHTQNRAREKRFLAEHGLPHVESRYVRDRFELDTALRELGGPVLLKSAGFGYDGKGQVLLDGPEDSELALGLLDSGPAVMERFVEFRRELSVLVARSPESGIRTFGPIENRHRDRILDVSSVPATAAPATASAAVEIARAVAEGLDLTGVLCVEFFELAGAELLVNEIAPRPHNSGHLSIEACTVSQFEQQLRAVCALPLGEMELRSPAAMANLLGDLWQGGEPDLQPDWQPDWRRVLAEPAVNLHLYGKAEPRPGRKMGHLTATGSSAEESLALVERARSALSNRR